MSIILYELSDFYGNIANPREGKKGDEGRMDWMAALRTGALAVMTSSVLLFSQSLGVQAGAVRVTVRNDPPGIVQQGGPPPGLIRIGSYSGGSLTINTDIDYNALYGAIFVGELSLGFTGEFTVILDSGTSVTYNVVLTDPASGLNLKDYLTVIKCPVSQCSGETDSETDGSIIPPDYNGQGNVSTGDTSDKWIITLVNAPGAIGDYAARIYVCSASVVVSPTPSPITPKPLACP